MMAVKSDILKSLTVAGVALFANAADAQDDTPTHSTPIVLELFTSQSCSSCVAAANYFRKAAARDDIVALAWHVDYWNYLNTKDGHWVDPYSSAEYTNRQRQYNINLRKRSSVYTPQIVVGGMGEAVGSASSKVNALIKMYQSGASPTPVITAKQDEAIAFTVGASAAGGNAYLVTFKPYVMTEIKGGENAGLNFSGANVVTGVTPLGVIRRQGAQLSVTPPTGDEGCALIVQEPGQGRIVAARYCPTE